MSADLFDPTISSSEESINFVARPKDLKGLRVGLVDNTKFNSKVLLEKVAERLKVRYGIETTHLDTKQSPSHGVDETAVKEFKTKSDFVIAGIGD